MASLTAQGSQPGDAAKLNTVAETADLFNLGR